MMNMRKQSCKKHCIDDHINHKNDNKNEDATSDDVEIQLFTDRNKASKFQVSD